MSAHIESLTLHESHAEIERLRTDNATLRAALQAHGEEAAKMMQGEPIAEWRRKVAATPNPKEAK